MCGVIGYVGRRHAKERLLAGLERLEYRGYDSAGICLVDGDGLTTVKAVGKLENLKGKINGHAYGATTGIGHTRWATHGRVTEQNAHPLTAGDHQEVAIVLNGIIENHAELRRRLNADGERFASETDAEVVAHLVRMFYDGCLATAVRAARSELEGHYAFIAVHADQPGVLVGTRRECPLLAGMGDGETFLASSITAFSADTRRIKLIEDDEIVAITADGVTVLDARGDSLERDEVVVTWDDEVAEKGGYESYMLKEIHEQPNAIATTIARNLEGAALELDRVGDIAAIRRVLVLACGTAYHAGLAARYAIEQWAGLPCDVEVASEWRYRDPRVEPGTLVIAISQSGETADTLAGVRLARARGARTLAITNSPGSQLTREVDAVLHTHAGLEMGVAATKTFTTQVVVMALLAQRIGERRGVLAPAEAERLLSELRGLPAKVRAALAAQDGIEEAAQRHADKAYFFFLGRHAGLPIALEGALKLKEIAYIPTESYAAGEMKHGPIALLDDETPVVSVATRSHVSDKLLSNLAEVRARGAQVIAVACEGDADIDAVAEDVLRVPSTHPLLQGVVAIVPLQLLAYRIARLRGLDADQPRNLAKTVTVE
ncbi:MAG TPA: glutamine--fructose-6-phosphate transaminase (isomerizing) [Solirubrobacteraceae bacterium]|nr:glutamine--fructose-6-phosphate transaminase (isomerizing) [Solirubrobacteraceae bacterium]